MSRDHLELLGGEQDVGIIRHTGILEYLRSHRADLHAIEVWRTR